MKPEAYRRQAILAENRAGIARSAEVRTWFLDIAARWHQLAGQVELLDARFGGPRPPPSAARTGSSNPGVRPASGVILSNARRCEHEVEEREKKRTQGG
jgi:hypothetical protein